MQNDIAALIKKYAISHEGSPFYDAYSPIFIYGAGNMGKDVCRVMTSQGIRVEAFLDRKASAGEQWNGIPVYPLDWDGMPLLQRQQTGVIIALHNRDVEIPPIIEDLRERRCGRIINMVEFYDFFAEEMGDRFWLTSRAAYNEWESDIIKGYSVWEDKFSKQLYVNLLRLRLAGDYACLPPPDQDHQYFPSDIPAWKSPLRVIDGGAYDGDTLRCMLNSQYVIESIAAFEPDLINFNKLCEYISAARNKETYLWPCGIYSSTRQLKFADGGAESSKLSKAGSTTIQVVALDDVIPSFKPNLIKFDIEGAEYDALLGARRIITEDRPGLAICLYHRPQDLWRIPLLVKSWRLRYKLYMRSHGYNGFDVVMYAIPN